MAAKKSKANSRSKAKARALTPAVRYLRYHLTNSGTPGTETSHFFDLARDLSIVNRRLYRQGRDYHIKKVTIVSTNTISGLYPGAVPGSAEQQNTGRVSISCIPDSWVARGAWNRGYQTWKRMNAEVLEHTAGDITAKWSDFKIHMTNDSRQATKPVPLDNGSAAYLQGEWNYTDLVTPDGTTADDTFTMHMMGNHSGSVGNWVSVGLIKSYGESRATVNTNVPNVPGDFSDDPLLNVFDYGTTIDEVADLIEGENDNPPYDIDDYPGTNGNGSKPLVVQDGAISDGRVILSGFNALLGLLEVEITSPIADDVYSVLIELAPGKFRGIKAESV